MIIRNLLLSILFPLVLNTNVQMEAKDYLLADMVRPYNTIITLPEKEIKEDIVPIEEKKAPEEIQVIVPEIVVPACDTTALEIRGTLTKEVESKVLSLYGLLPSNMKQKIEATGYKVIVDSSGAITNGHAGQTDVFVSAAYNVDGNGYIGINGSSVNKTSIAVVHEIGHWFDAILGAENGMNNFYSSNAEFVGIYNEEIGNSGYPSYNSGSPEEFFAETFRYMYENPSRVQTNTPKAYSYILNLLSLYGYK